MRSVFSGAELFFAGKPDASVTNVEAGVDCSAQCVQLSLREMAWQSLCTFAVPMKSVGWGCSVICYGVRDFRPCWLETDAWVASLPPLQHSRCLSTFRRSASVSFTVLNRFRDDAIQLRTLVSTRTRMSGVDICTLLQCRSHFEILRSQMKIFTQQVFA